jgi:hypothetical protein
MDEKEPIVKAAINKKGCCTQCGTDLRIYDELLELDPKFRIGQRVIFKLAGIEAFIENYVYDGYILLYTCSYWVDGQLKTSRHDDYEIEPCDENGVGFKKK